MKNIKKALLSLLSCILIITTVILPIYASAGVLKTGSCGDNAYYTIYSDGQLIISGSGDVHSIYFGGYTVTSITYEEGITSSGFFSSLTSLTRVQFPSTLKVIDENAFHSASKLSTVIFSEGLEEIGARAFYCCKALTNISFPSTLEKIGDSAFYQDTKLEDVDFNFGLEEIGVSAFKLCQALEEVTFPASLVSIGKEAFYECSALESVAFSGTGSATIGEAAFGDCTNLAMVSIDGAVSVIGTRAFENCTSLRYVIAGKGLKEIGESAFYGCTALSSFDLPEGLTTIGNSAFRGCISLYSIKMPSSLKTLGTSVYYGCTGISSVTLSKSLKNIPNYTFYGCKGIETITIPSNITKIGDYAFYGCTGLKKITIPASITEICDYSFSDCSSLSEVTVLNKNAVFGYYCFDDVSNDVVFFGYPNSTTQTYAGSDFVSLVCKAPKLVSLKNNKDGITIKWEKSANAKKYKVMRKVNGATSWSVIATVGATTTSYKDKKVSSGNKYTYTVRAIGSLADGEYNKTGLKTYWLAVPSTPTATSTKNGISVKWKAVKGATSYNVYRAQNNGNIKKVATVTAKSYLDKDVTYNNSYTYYIVAVNKTGSVTSTSVRSLPKTVKCKHVKSTTITSVKVKTMGTVEIKWASVRGATSYRVYRSTNANSGYKKIATVSKTTYLDKTVKLGTKYFYKIVAAAGSGTSAYSPAKSVTATVGSTTYKAASVDGSTITLNWKPVTNVDGYFVYRKSGSTWIRIATVKGASNTTYKDTVKGLQSYRIIAYKSQSGKTYTSAAVEGKFRTLGKPKITVDMYNNEFKEIIKWNKVGGANNYQVYRRVGKTASWGSVATTDKLQYIGAVRHGIYYYWKVRAMYKNNGNVSIGQFSAVDDLSVNQTPKLVIWVSDETEPDAAGVFIHITNNGDYPVTFFSNRASIWNGSDYPHLNGSIKMFDYNALQNGSIKYISSCKIPAHSEAWLCFDITGPKRGWYDAYTVVSVYFKYGTIDYVMRTNAISNSNRGTWTEI